MSSSFERNRTFSDDRAQLVIPNDGQFITKQTLSYCVIAARQLREEKVSTLKTDSCKGDNITYLSILIPFGGATETR